MAERQITLEDLIFMTSQSDWLYYSNNINNNKFKSHDTSIIEYLYDKTDYPYVYTQEEGSNTLYRFFGTPTIEDISHFLSNHYANHSKVFIENTLYDCMPIFRSQYPYIINKLLESDITISSVNSVNDKYILYVIFRTSKSSSMGGGSDLYTYQNVSRSQSSTQDQFAYYYGEFENLLNALKQSTDKIIYFEFGYIFDNQKTENNISVLHVNEIKNVLTKLDLSIANVNISDNTIKYIFADNSTNYESKQTYNISDVYTLKPTFSFNINTDIQYTKLGWCTMTNVPNASCGLDINGHLDQYKYGKNISSGVDINSEFFDFNNNRIYSVNYNNCVILDGPTQQNYQNYLFPYIEIYDATRYVFDFPAIKISYTDAQTLYSPILDNINIQDFEGSIYDKKSNIRTNYLFNVSAGMPISSIDVSIYSTYAFYQPNYNNVLLSPAIDCLLVADIFLTDQQFSNITDITNISQNYNWQTYDNNKSGSYDFIYEKIMAPHIFNPSFNLIGQHKPIILGLIRNIPFETYIQIQQGTYKLTNLQLHSNNCKVNDYVPFVSSIGYYIDLLFDFNDNNCLEKKMLDYYYNNISKYLNPTTHAQYAPYIENTRFILLPNIQQLIKKIDVQIDSLYTNTNAKINAYTEIKNIDNLGHTI